jgi:hypothetical protein
MVPDWLETGGYRLTASLSVDGTVVARTDTYLFWVQHISATGPSGPITGPTATLSGVGRNGASVSIIEGGVTVAATTVVDGKWSVQVEGISVGTHTYVVEHRLGNDTISPDDVVVTRLAPVGADFAVSAPADPAKGYEPNASFTFSGTAPLGTSAVTIRNSKGTLVATAPVDASKGTWSWARANMGTSIWKLTFILDEGTAGEKRVVLGSFAPRVEAPADRPVAFTNPTDADAGYVANTSFTFRGTATPGATLLLKNDKGTIIAKDIVVDGNGDWSWTRPNMGTSIWKITAVATTGDGKEQTVSLAPFAPRK